MEAITQSSSTQTRPGSNLTHKRIVTHVRTSTYTLPTASQRRPTPKTYVWPTVSANRGEALLENSNAVHKKSPHRSLSIPKPLNAPNDPEAEVTEARGPESSRWVGGEESGSGRESHTTLLHHTGCLGSYTDSAPTSLPSRHPGKGCGTTRMERLLGSHCCTSCL